MANSLTKLRYRHVPDHLFGEVLSKPWIDNAVPFIALIATLGTFMALQPSMFSAYGLVDLSRQLAEFGLLVVALTVVMISGGIDLAIGSIFALCILTIMTCLNVLGWPLGTSVLATAGVGAFCGAINGVLIGFLRLRTAGAMVRGAMRQSLSNGTVSGTLTTTEGTLRFRAWTSATHPASVVELRPSAGERGAALELVAEPAFARTNQFLDADRMRNPPPQCSSAAGGGGVSLCCWS